MLKTMVTVAGLAALAASSLPADFSYQETTKITGGVVVSAMKVMGVFSKQARQAGEPIQSTVAVKGDRMVHRSPTHATVIDLGSQTITSIDLQKKTWSVMTFDEMKQALEETSRKMSDNKNKGEMKFKVSASPTGKTRQFAGFEAKEMVLKMEMEGTDKQSGQKGSMVVMADTWIAPQVPGYDEVKKFYQRMAEKMSWTPSGNMFMSRPDVAQGMAEVYKESSKLNGMPVFQTTVMGPEGTAPVDASDRPAAAPQQKSDRPSMSGALGSALGGRFGLGKKKSQPEPEQAPPPAAQGNSGSASGVLLEMTTELAGFSSAPVDASQFEVPAGFQKVQPDFKKAGQ
jgi:hypothetical protein